MELYSNTYHISSTNMGFSWWVFFVSSTWDYGWECLFICNTNWLFVLSD